MKKLLFLFFIAPLSIWAQKDTADLLLFKIGNVEHLSGLYYTVPIADLSIFHKGNKVDFTKEGKMIFQKDTIVLNSNMPYHVVSGAFQNLLDEIYQLRKERDSLKMGNFNKPKRSKYFDKSKNKKL